MAKLSPAAQALANAVDDEWSSNKARAADVLYWLADLAGSTKHWHVDQIRAIAAELEGQQ
jgi:hypothetical protein